MKILMTTDGSGHAITAINSAGRLIRKEDVKADVLCVVPELVVAGTARQSKWITLAAEEVLRRQCVESNPVVEYGSPADEILKLASDYDLVVVGAHGRHERRQPGLGPVSSHIVQNARTSVFVGRDLSSESIYRVLVALDGSDAGFEALRSLGSNFDISSMDVTLMHVVELPWTSQDPESAEEGDGDELSGYQGQLLTELRREADRIIDRGLRRLEKFGVAATTIVEEGDPALELTSHIEEGNYDLAVIGATGVSDMKHALLGSVSQKVAWNAPCSVLIVRS